MGMQSCRRTEIVASHQTWLGTPTYHRGNEEAGMQNANRRRRYIRPTFCSQHRVAVERSTFARGTRFVKHRAARGINSIYKNIWSRLCSSSNVVEQRRRDEHHRHQNAVGDHVYCKEEKYCLKLGVTPTCRPPRNGTREIPSGPTRI